MLCTTNLLQEIMELFCAGDINSRIGSGDLQPISTSKNYGYNKWLMAFIQNKGL